MTLPCGQCVDDNDGGGLDLGRHTLHQLQRFQSRAAGHTGGQSRHRGKGLKLQGQRRYHVPRDQQVLQRHGAHRVGGHGPVAQTHHHGGGILTHAGQQGGQLLSKTPCPPAEKAGLAAEVGVQVNGYIAAHGLFHAPCAGFVGDVQHGHAVALAHLLGDAHAVLGRKCFFSTQIFRRFQR